MRGPEPVLLRDSRGIVFLSAVPAWLFHAIRPVPPAEARWVAEHGQYGSRGRFEILPWQIQPRSDTPGYVLRTDATAAA